jgi:hypothetical protein
MAATKTRKRQAKQQAGKPAVAVVTEALDPWDSTDPVGVGNNGSRSEDQWRGLSRQLLVSTVEDRTGGRWRPVYETEMDLARIRAQCREVAAFTSTSIGALESLTNYVVGSGFDFNIVPLNPQVPAPMVEFVQKVVDAVLDESDFRGLRDREIHNSTRVDGESLLVVRDATEEGGLPRICSLDPSMLTEPPQSAAHQIGDWLGSNGDTSWTFGVHCRLHPDTGAEDTDNPLGYHVIYDSAGWKWEYIPADHAAHLKRNVGSGAKRGVSDFYAVLDDLLREPRLQRYMAHGATMQAAIAFIRELPRGTTRAGAEGIVSANMTSTREQITQQGRQTVKQQYMPPGSRLDIPAGMKYHAGPMGAGEAAKAWIEVLQALLRSIGRRWNMAEYLISGDASNSAYASTLVAEAPFVRAREADQIFYGRHFRDIAWKALTITWQSNPDLEARLPWQVVESQLDLQVVGPEVSSRDLAVVTQRSAILKQNKILSKRTWAQQAGLDYEAEQKQIRVEEAEEAKAAGAMGGGTLAPLPEQTGGNGRKAGFREGTEIGNVKLLSDAHGVTGAAAGRMIANSRPRPGLFSTGAGRPRTSGLHDLPHFVETYGLMTGPGGVALVSPSGRPRRFSLLEDEAGTGMGAACGAGQLGVPGFQTGNVCGSKGAIGGLLAAASVTGMQVGSPAKSTVEQAQQPVEFKTEPGAEPSLPYGALWTEQLRYSVIREGEIVQALQEAVEDVGIDEPEASYSAQSEGQSTNPDWQDGNAEIGVVVTLEDGSEIGVVVAVLTEQLSATIRLPGPEAAGYNAWRSGSPGRSLVLVVVDDRDIFAGGKHQTNYSGSKLYLGEPAESVELSKLEVVGGLSALASRILGLELAVTSDGADS